MAAASSTKVLSAAQHTHSTRWMDINSNKDGTAPAQLLLQPNHKDKISSKSSFPAVLFNTFYQSTNNRGAHHFSLVKVWSRFGILCLVSQWIIATDSKGFKEILRDSLGSSRCFWMSQSGFRAIPCDSECFFIISTTFQLVLSWFQALSNCLWSIPKVQTDSKRI